MMIFEGLAMLTGIDLVVFVSKQVLDLGTNAMKGYVNSFFKESIRSGVVALEQRQALEIGMAEAIVTLTQLFGPWRRLAGNVTISG